MASTPRSITRDIGGVNPNNYTQSGVVDNSLATAITGVTEAALTIDKEVQTRRLDSELENLRTEYLTSSAPSKAVQDGHAMSDDDAGEVARFSTELVRGKTAVDQGRGVTWDSYRIRGETLLRTAIARRPGLAEHFRRIAANTLGTDVVGASVLFLAEQERSAADAANKGGPDIKRARDDLDSIGVPNADWSEQQVLSVYSDPRVREQITERRILSATVSRGREMGDLDSMSVTANRQATYIQAEGFLAERSQPLHEAAVKLENLFFASGTLPSPEEISSGVLQFRMAVQSTINEARRAFIGKMPDEDIDSLLAGYQTVFDYLDKVATGEQLTEVNATKIKAMIGIVRQGILNDPNAANMAAISENFGPQVMVGMMEADSTIRNGMSNAITSAMTGQGTGDPVVAMTNAAQVVDLFAISAAEQTDAQKAASAAVVTQLPQAFTMVPDAKYNYQAYGAFVDKLAIHSPQLARDYPEGQRAQLLDGLAVSTAHYIDNVGRTITTRSQYAGLRGKVEVGLQENGDILRLIPGETVSDADRNTIREFNTRYRVGANVLTVFQRLGGQDAATTAKRIRDIRSAGVQAGVARGRAMEVTLGSGENKSINREGYELYAPVAMAAAEKYGIESSVLTSLITQESGWNPDAVSGTGVRGIAQVTRPTAIGLGYTAENYTTPSNQIYGAANYVSQMLKRFKGDYTLAIAAYNAGPGALDTFLRTGERTGNLAKGGAYAGAEGSQTETYISKVLGFDGDLLTYGRGVLGIQPPEDNATAGGP
jgi:hypothetical protein